MASVELEATEEIGYRLATAPVGLIVPPQDGSVPIDATLVYPSLTFSSVGLGLRRMEAGDYGEATSRIVDKARELASRGVAAIGVMGTSLTFFQGKSGNVEIERAVHAATGLPCVTMSTGLAQGLVSVGSKSPVLASAYSAEVHTQLESYLQEEGFEPLSGAHMDIVELDVLERVTAQDVVELGARAWAESDGSGDALVLSCGGFRTRGAMLLLEEELGVPVISSAVAGVWAVVDAAGHDPRVPALGRLLHTRPSRPGRGRT